jgi:hypothetical protein
MISCSNQNVNALNQNTFNLLNRFCSCSKAKKLIDASASIAPLFIETGDFPHPRAYFSGDGATISGVRIEIPKESPSKKLLQVLSHLTFELYNAKNGKKAARLSSQASSGKVSMDEYAKKKLRKSNIMLCLAGINCSLFVQRFGGSIRIRSSNLLPLSPKFSNIISGKQKLAVIPIR